MKKTKSKKTKMIKVKVGSKTWRFEQPTGDQILSLYFGKKEGRPFLDWYLNDQSTTKIEQQILLDFYFGKREVPSLDMPKA